MTKYFVLCFLMMTVTAVSVRGSEFAAPDIAAKPRIAGLTLDDSGAAPVDAPPPDPSKSCADVSFSRNLKYGESDLNVLDVATGAPQATSPRPVLLFVGGESFAGSSGAPDVAGPLPDQAMCFAARNGIVGVTINYRMAPASAWPAGTQDVAAAISWVHQNIDLFSGNPHEIVVLGFSAGAFHVASLLAHPEFQESDSSVAGAALVSGIYRSSPDASAAEKSYFGADPGKYDERSAFPGILNIETPILLAWSAIDPPRLIEQGEKLRERLCNSATHCPHTTVLKERDNPSSAFGLDAGSGSLVQPILELIREIEARGLP